MNVSIKCARCGVPQSETNPRLFGTCKVCLRIICGDCCGKTSELSVPGVCVRCVEIPEVKGLVVKMMMGVGRVMSQFDQELREFSASVNLPSTTEKTEP
jgi:hypothetical protein